MWEKYGNGMGRTNDSRVIYAVAAERPKSSISKLCAVTIVGTDAATFVVFQEIINSSNTITFDGRPAEYSAETINYIFIY